MLKAIRHPETPDEVKDELMACLNHEAVTEKVDQIGRYGGLPWPASLPAPAVEEESKEV